MSHNYYPGIPDCSDILVRPDALDTPDVPDVPDTPDAPPDTPLTPNTILQDRYRIVRQLGRGGMGAVYEAVDQRLGKTLAIKETLSSEASMRKQFEREARLLAVMHHPALPKVTDHFVESNRAFLVMEFIGGRDLAKIIAQQPGPFPRDQVIAWADQLLDALIYLHTRDRQVIHRDIKPHNLKLTATGQIALLDFGLAKAQPSDPSVTSSQAFFGYTRHYAPLEQIQDQRTDPRSDIYALGATLYHLLTGVKPPDAMVRAAAVVNGGADPLLPANEIHAAVGPQIAAILNKAMAQKPEDRYTDAQEFREALRRMGRTPAGAEAVVENWENEPRINADARRSGTRVVAVPIVSNQNVGSVQQKSVPSPASQEPLVAQQPCDAQQLPNAQRLRDGQQLPDAQQLADVQRPPAYAGGSDKRAHSSSKRIVNASGTDIFVEPPDMQMALVGSARRFGPAGVTVVLAVIFAIAGGILYGAQRFFPVTESAADSLSVAPNAAASLHSSAGPRKTDRARVAESAVIPRTANVTTAPVERVPENPNASDATGASGSVKSQPEKNQPEKSQAEKRSLVELTKSQTEKRTGVTPKPTTFGNASGSGQESPRTAPRKEPRRVGAPSIRFPNVDYRDNSQDNAPAPSPESRVRSSGPPSVAGKPASSVVPRPASSSGGPKFYRAADGTQIVKFPDGSTQYVRPGQRSAGGGYR